MFIELVNIKVTYFGGVPVMPVGCLTYLVYESYSAPSLDSAVHLDFSILILSLGDSGEAISLKLMAKLHVCKKKKPFTFITKS